MRSPVNITALKRGKKETSFKIETESDLFSEGIRGFIILKVYLNVIGKKNAVVEIHTDGSSLLTETAPVKNGWERMISEALILADDLGALSVAASTTWYPDWFKELLVACGFKKIAWPYYYAELRQPEEKGK